MKRYQRLAKEFVTYHVVENIHTEKGRRDVEKLFQQIIREARADARREERIWNGNEKRVILNMEKLKKRKPTIVLYRPYV